MAARTASQVVFYETGPFLQEEWNVTGTYVAGTDTLNAITPQKIKIVKAVKGNFATWTVSSGAYSFTFAASVSKPVVTFVGYGR